MLEAARARQLGLTEESAESWGLNRAIFYAAAKRGFKGGGTIPKKGESVKKGEHATTQEYYLGDEMAFKDERSPDGELYFVIGGKTQTEKDFERQVKARFYGNSYEKARAEAEAITKKYDRSVLESARYFFDQVYKPRRDTLVEKWSELSEKEQEQEKNKKKKTERKSHQS